MFRVSMSFRRMAGRAACLCTVLLASACSPAFDWREVRADERLAAWFPCKVARHERSVALAGAQRPMRMVSCSANGQLFAVSRVEGGDEPVRTQVLEGLRQALGDNLGGAAEAAPESIRSRIAGETPHTGAIAMQWRGRRADGATVVARSRLFCHGSQIYQATLVGPSLDAAASETFFGALRLQP